MARIKTLAGFKVEQFTSPNRGGRMSAHRGVVAHIAQGFYAGTKAWQMNPNQRYADGTQVTTCSTWIIGKKTGEIAQMVDSDEIAWCQRDGSRRWLSAELVGFAPDAPTAWQAEALAHILVWDHRQHGTPLRVAAHEGERGLGHHSMDREWLGIDWGHEACPGTGVIKAKPAIVRRALEIVKGEDDMSLRDLVNMVNEKTGKRWSFGKILGKDEITVEAALGYAAAGGWQLQHDVVPILSKLLAGQAALIAAHAGEDVVAAMRTELDRHRGLLVAGLGDEFAPALLAELAPALIAELGEAARQLPVEVVEAAVGRAAAASVRRVLEQVRVTVPAADE